MVVPISLLIGRHHQLDSETESLPQLPSSLVEFISPSLWASLVGDKDSEE